MSLTPEDVISKTFLPTRFAEGYNQDEVDDFLDEVVSTLRAKQSEIDELEAKLRASEAEVADLRSRPLESSAPAVHDGVQVPLLKQRLAPDAAAQRSDSLNDAPDENGMGANAEDVFGAREHAVTPNSLPSDAVPSDTVPSDAVPSDTVPSDTVPSDTVPSDTVPDNAGPENAGSDKTVSASPQDASSPRENTEGASGAAGMLFLAQRLHDEHVRNGENQRDILIAEAQARAEQLVGDAEETRTTTLATLQIERDELQSYIEGLRAHEEEYRSRLRSFLQAQLSDLESQHSLEPDAAPI